MITTLPCSAASAAIRFISAMTAGWTILLSTFSSSGSLNTMSATAWRSSVPSSPTIRWPHRSTIALKTAPPGDWSSLVTASASTMTAPRAASRLDTDDLPEPMPPVNVTRITRT